MINEGEPGSRRLWAAPLDIAPPHSYHRGMRCLLSLLICLCLACGSSSPSASTSARPSGPDLKVANAANPGERIEVDVCLASGKETLVEFYSDRCPPCREMERVLSDLASRRPDLAIRRLNIDRLGSAGIDFDSPLAEQYSIDAVPAFRIYDQTGKLKLEGKPAKDQVRSWYSSSQQMDRGEADPGTRQIMDGYAR